MRETEAAAQITASVRFAATRNRALARGPGIRSLVLLSSPRRGGGGGVGEEKEGVGESKGGAEEAKVDVASDSAAREQEEQQRRLRELQVRVVRGSSTCRSGATAHVAVCTRRNQVSSRTLGLQHAASPVFTQLGLRSRATKTRSQNAFSSHQNE